MAQFTLIADSLLGMADPGELAFHEMVVFAKLLQFKGSKLFHFFP